MTTEMSPFAHSIYAAKYAHEGEQWPDTSRRVVETVMASAGYGKSSTETQKLVKFVAERKFLPGGRYLAATGRPYHQTQNCLLLRAEDSREGWAELLWKSAMSLQTGAGIGIDYSDIRPKGSIIKRTGGVASGPVELMKMVNEVGRGIVQGGNRRSAIWAGLKWSHPDVLEFISMKNWEPHLVEAKSKNFSAYAPMDMTNISVLLDDAFFEAYAKGDEHAVKVFKTVVRQMFVTGEPGFSVNLGDKDKETLRNACTEVTSENDSDICNLGSINLARVETLNEKKELVDLGSLFLLAGTLYSDVPYAKVGNVRTKNRRLGLGLMGLHEWLAVRGHKYGPNEELARWLEIYEQSGEFANAHADRLGLSRPVATRAIAPTGTIAIIAETTTGIEPIFCVAYKRRYYAAGGVWKYQYVIDPTAKKLVEKGVDPDKIEDAYALSYDMERRLAFQAWVQGYVDMSISSTINMPAWGTAANNESTLDLYADLLIKYLPKLRGITVYPDGARGGQPLVPCTYAEAAGKEGVVFEESEERCVGGACGT